MQRKTLRSDLIRLAAEHPETRPHLLPLLGDGSRRAYVTPQNLHHVQQMGQELSSTGGIIGGAAAMVGMAAILATPFLFERYGEILHEKAVHNGKRKQRRAVLEKLLKDLKGAHDVLAETHELDLNHARAQADLEKKTYHMADAIVDHVRKDDPGTRVRVKDVEDLLTEHLQKDHGDFQDAILEQVTEWEKDPGLVEKTKRLLNDAEKEVRKHPEKDYWTDVSEDGGVPKYRPSGGGGADFGTGQIRRRRRADGPTDPGFRSRVIRLAHENPDLRPLLLPLLAPTTPRNPV